MQANELRKKFIEFFIQKGHKEFPSVSLVPEDDSSILFTPAGMSPLVRYLMGEPHPLGKRLCSVQKCLRVDDLEEVGDLTHFTFFEMLGNWSLGDYFKKEAISWSMEFLTDKKWLGLDPQKIYVSIFAGDKDASKDIESIKIWQETFKKLGIKAKEEERIFAYGKQQNWWGPAGLTGPCGPDTEMFYDTGKKHDLKFGPKCHPNCQCGRFFEIWNDVFMQYNKKEDGSFIPLKQKNVDTGMGLERVVALTEYLEAKISSPDPFQAHLFAPIILEMEKLSNKIYQASQRDFRIIADHLRASVFLINDGVEPSNKDRGYVLRKIIRRAAIKLQGLIVDWQKEISPFCKHIISSYGDLYFSSNQADLISTVLTKEIDDFLPCLHRGMKLLQTQPISVELLFNLYQSDGFPFELAQDLLSQWKKPLSEKVIQKVNEKIKAHQEKSRTASKGRFKGGLADHSEKIVKLHTATHLLHSALRKILGIHVQQIGSNITEERLRFDFTHPKPLSEVEIKKVEALVNEEIKKNHPITCQTLDLAEAKKQGALAFFGQKYPEKVTVYQVGPNKKDQLFSLEVCAGPHVGFTGKLGVFKIKKEESSGNNKRRIYGVLE